MSAESDPLPEAEPVSQETPTTVSGWGTWIGVRALLAVGWGVAAGHAFVAESGFVIRAKSTFDAFERMVHESWVLVALGGSLPCLAAWVWLLLAAPPSPRPEPPQGWPGAVARGVALSAVLSAAFALYLACGGHDVFYSYDWTPVGNAALVAPLLGVLSLVERRQAGTLRSRLGWSTLVGVGAFVALLLAWTQREYVNEFFIQGVGPASQHVLTQLGWLSEDPVWTLRYFGWIALPVGALTFARLRPRGERTCFALAFCGVGIPWLIPFVYWADAVIVTGCVFLCTLTQVAWWLGDRAQAKTATLLLDRPQ